MKRFTETEKWRDSWFQGLSPDAKLVFGYMTDTCDAAGVWDPNEKLAEFSIGKRINWGSVYAELDPKVLLLKSNKLIIVRFVAFQYGDLTDTCAPHRKVLRVLQSHGIEYPVCTLSLPLVHTAKDKEEDKEEEEDRKRDVRRSVPPEPGEVTAYSAEIGYPLDGAAWCDSYAQKGWSVGKGKMKDWRAAVRNWKANGWIPGKAKNGAQLEERFDQF